jgi:ribosomal 50S subunit-recycling heat shock protein
MAEPQIQQITQSQTTIPDYARSYVENLLGLSEGTAFQYQRDAQGNVVRDAAGLPIPSGFQPYQQYQGERFAQFSPMQQQAFQQAQQMRPSAALEDAASLAGLAGLNALNYKYTPGQATNQFVVPQQFQPSSFTATGVSSPDLKQYQIGAPERVASMAVQSPTINAAQTQYAPQLRAFQMDAPSEKEKVTSQTFTAPGTAGTYMSPYLQEVVDIEKREAQRQADIASTQRGAKFAQAGAFGGARQAIENAEAARNLAMQKGDIQSRGLQSAYQQAQQQFNAEQAARQAAQQVNLGAGLTVGQQNLAAQLGVQQLGTQTGLQAALANLSSSQQAAVQNAANNLQAQGMTAQQALQAALANQQLGFNAGQLNLQSQLGTQQLGAQQNLQAQLANQQARLQAQQLAEQSKQYGYGQQLQAAGLGAQYGQAAQQLNEQSAQFGAGLGLQGLQTAMTGAGQLGQLGQTQFGQQMGINQLLGQYGGQQQQQAQNILGAQYQDFLNAQNQPYKQLGFMSDMLRGLPLSQSASTMYQQPPSMTSQLAGLGTAAAGFSKLFAKGGAVDSRPAGLADLAISRMG